MTRCSRQVRAAPSLSGWLNQRKPARSVPALLRGQHHPPGEGDYAGRGGIAGAQLKSFIERVEQLEEEKRALGEDIKEVYAEAKGTGFQPKIMRQILKIRKMDKDEHDEQESLLDIYKRALGMLQLAHIEQTAERTMTRQDAA